MKDLQEKVLNTIKNYNLIEEGDKIIVAVSGGPDSICLLNVLNELYSKQDSSPLAKKCQKDPSLMAVVHVNHMIREEAFQDEEFVRNFCKEKGFEFYSKSIDVQKLANNNRIGTEEAGRIARYEFFDEILQKTGANKIAIAHNKNDKAETIIMNLLRGSGITGLKGIEPKRGKYIKPLIDCERAEIEAYCRENNIEARIDKTNFDNVYTRNKIRNVVIPYIKQEFNPNIIDTLDRLSKLVCEQEDYMKEQVEKIYTQVVVEEKLANNRIMLDLKKFNSQERVIKSRLLLYTITKLLGDSQGIEKIHIDDVIKLCNNNIGNKYLTPNKRIKILVKNHKIYFISTINEM